ncbi:MAG TPA: ABC transporter permease [Patescibacteria group bacterium]|nr:ABC transporter permease [Patescibacteria group bacterium]
MRDVKNPALWLLSPFLAVMGVFFAAPLLLVVGYSFMTQHYPGGVEFPLTLDAYIKIFYDTDFDGNRVFDASFLMICWKSLQLAGICTILCLLAGFPMAYFMATRPAHQRNLWMMLVTIPFWTNLLIRTYSWMLILRTDGLVNNALIDAGLIKEPLELLYNDFAVGVGLLYSYLPFMVLPIYANLERMDWRLIEAASDLYATRWQTLRKVTLPLTMPGIIAGCILVFIPSIGSFLAPQLLGGGQQMMIGNKIENLFGQAGDWPFGSAASVALMAIVMIGLMIMSRRGGLKELV